MLITIITLIITGLLLFGNYKTFQHAMKIKKLDVRQRFAHGLINCIILIISFNVCLYQFTFGRNIQSYLVKNAAFLVAIFSFSMQQVLSDLIGGMMVAMSKPYDIGERIHLASKDVSGIVEDITIRHTVVKCYDNTRLVVPNSVINREILRNSNYADCLCGNFIEIFIAFDSDLDKAIKIMENAIYNHPLTLYKGKKEGVQKELDVQVFKFAKEGIGLKSVIWTSDTDANFMACSQLRKEIYQKFKKNGITVTG